MSQRAARVVQTPYLSRTSGSRSTNSDRTTGPINSLFTTTISSSRPPTTGRSTTTGLPRCRPPRDQDLMINHTGFPSDKRPANTTGALPIAPANLQAAKSPKPAPPNPSCPELSPRSSKNSAYLGYPAMASSATLDGAALATQAGVEVTSLTRNSIPAAVVGRMSPSICRSDQRRRFIPHSHPVGPSIEWNVTNGTFCRSMPIKVSRLTPAQVAQ